MELYKRNIGYGDIGRTSNLVVTATTIYLPIFLTQSFEDIGIFTDTNNPVIEVVTGLTGFWDTTGNTGVNQKKCLVLNNCGIGTPVIQAPSFYGASDGFIQVNSVTNCPQAFSYVWSGPTDSNINGVTNTLNPTGLIAGTYVLKITDANCDISYHTMTLPQPQYLTTSTSLSNSQVNDVNGDCNGSASVSSTGGKSPYTYSWFIKNGNSWVDMGLTTTTITGLCAGEYMVQVSDSKVPPTLVTSMFKITEPSALSGSVVTTINIDCNGGNNGYIKVVGSGGLLTTGYTYTLSPGLVVNNDGIFSNLVADTYSITVTDNAGSNFNISPINIIQPMVVSGIISSQTNAGCYGETSGSFTVTPSGGNGQYVVKVKMNGVDFGTYSTNGPITISDLQASDYTVNIEDTNNCVSTTLVQNIRHYEDFLVSVTKPNKTNGFDIPCYSGITQITATTVFDVLDAYTISTPTGYINFYLNEVYVGNCYHTSGNGCSKVITGITHGNYELTSVSNVGCSATTLVSITQPPMALSLNYGVIDGITGTTGTLPTLPLPVNAVVSTTDVRQGVIDINGGVSPYTITWSDGSTLLTSEVHSVGTVLTVSVTDDNGCTVGPISITLT